VVGLAPFETKEEPAISFRVGGIDVRASIIVGTFAPSSEKQDDGEKSGPTPTLSRGRSGRAALRREQWERLESKQRGKSDPREGR
jgi:hypothetical protein